MTLAISTLRSLLNTFVFTLGIFSSLGCGSGVSSSALTDLDGVWKTACFSLDSGSSALRLVVSNSTLVQTKYYFSDISCETPTYQIESTFKLSLPGRATSPSNAYKYSISNQSASVLPKSSATASSFNSSGFCGISGWSVDTKQDISGKTCNGLLNYLNIPGSVLYTIYTLTSDTLTFGPCGQSGSTTDCSSDSKRPTTVSLKSSDTFTKE